MAAVWRTGWDGGPTTCHRVRVGRGEPWSNGADNGENLNADVDRRPDKGYGRVAKICSTQQRIAGMVSRWQWAAAGGRQCGPSVFERAWECDDERFSTADLCLPPEPRDRGTSERVPIVD